MAGRAHLTEFVDHRNTNQATRRCDQAGAVCCRVAAAGSLEVLLITSRDTGRWVIPKGNIERKEEPHRCAQREAFEEAGIVGKVRKKPLGFYSYMKDGEHLLAVSLHLLKLDCERGDYPEKGKRKRIWVSMEQAGALVREHELRAIFTAMDLTNPLNSQDRVSTGKSRKSRRDGDTPDIPTANTL